MRQDISLAQQIVQSNHATFEVARRLPTDYSEVPHMVLIGVPDKAALFRVVEKLNKNDIGHQVFYEPDDNMGLSAVATVPLEQSQRRCLSNYAIWRDTTKDKQQREMLAERLAGRAVPPDAWLDCGTPYLSEGAAND